MAESQSNRSQSLCSASRSSTPGYRIEGRPDDGAPRSGSLERRRGPHARDVPAVPPGVRREREETPCLPNVSLGDLVRLIASEDIHVLAIISKSCLPESVDVELVFEIIGNCDMGIFQRGKGSGTDVCGDIRGRKKTRSERPMVAGNAVRVRISGRGCGGISG